MQRIVNGDLGYLGNPQVLRDGIQKDFTEHEISEYLKCLRDPAYFARKYVKVIHLDRGLVPFELYPYQEKMFDHFNANRFSIVLACRQSGKSISCCAYLLWYALFHAEQTVAILANKGATAREMLSRITLSLENVPFFLQPGCKTLNKGSIVFSNNSTIIAAATSGSSIRGKSVSLLYLDEFAFVENSTTFYTSTYPVISSGKSTKVIITSTANGVGNMFYQLWQGAVQGTNAYKSFRVDWWDVPGRDEAWKAMTISNTSELQFAQEFSNHFQGSADTLISSECLLALTAKSPISGRQPLSSALRNMIVYEEPVSNNDESGVAHSYLMTADVGKGRGQDYSTFSVFDTSVRPFKQVATFRDNTISPLLFPEVIYRAALKYNKALVIVENNDAGQVVCNGLYYDIEYENVFVESSVKSGGIGVTMSKSVKRIGCSNLKDLIEQGKLEICDAETISELSSFIPHGSSYAADDGCHDDLVMTLVMFSWFISTNAFGSISDLDLKSMLYSDRIREMEDDMVPFGFISAPSNPSTDRVTSMIEEKEAWKTL
jgi:hypothetical protein